MGKLTANPTIAVRRGRSTDLPAILAHARRDTDALGFLTAQAVREYLGRGRVLVVESRLMAPRACDLDLSMVVGFVLWRVSNGRRARHAALSTGRHAKVIQLCVGRMWRHEGFGTALVEALIRLARRRGCEFLSLWCAADLAANPFWLRMGFRLEGYRTGGERRGRSHNLFVLRLVAARRGEC